MKKIIIFIFSLLLTAVYIHAQGNISNYTTPVLVPVTTERSIPWCSFHGTVRVETNTTYSATTNVQWLKIEQTPRGINFVAEENSLEEIRTADITLKSSDGKITRHILITQDSEQYTNDDDSKARIALGKMTLDDKLELIVGTNTFYTKAISSIGLPQLFQSDGPQGVRTDNKSTAYPAGIMLASTWNKDMAYDYGYALGRDCRARGIQFILGPGVNIYRSPRGGRNFEYFGEDPWLTSQIACGYIKGVQTNKGVVCMMKHFAANFMEYGRLNTSSDVDERTLQEIYLPAFRHAVQDAKVGSIMSGYNLVNGVYCYEDEYLMQDVLRKQWNYPYMTVSDWGAPYYAVGSSWKADHIVDLLNHGVDLEAATPGYYQVKTSSAKQYIAEGKVLEENIDKKVLNILRTIYHFHLDESLTPDRTIALDNRDNAAVAYRAAAEGLVLLRNEKNLLPFDKGSVKRIGVMGSNADRYVAGSGSGLVKPFYCITPLQGLMTKGQELGIDVEFIDYSELEPIANKSDRTFFYTNENCTTPGFTAEYYNNRHLQGTPVLTRTEQVINNNWEKEPVSGIGSSDYSVMWTAYLKGDSLSKIKFSFTADDGMFLAIDGKRVIDDWNDNAEHTKTSEFTIMPGRIYKIEAGYYQAGGGAVAKLDVTRDSKNYKEQQLAKMGSCDAIVVCEGFNQDLEGENIDRTFALPTAKLQSINDAFKGGVPVVVIINSGGAVDMHTWFRNADGIVWAAYPGQEGGTAIADMLFGDINPSGKLPVTFEILETDNPTYNYYKATGGRVKFGEGLYVGYRGFQKNNKMPLYPFGFGLSYTTFALSNLQATSQEATVAVTNTGSRAGAEVVQIYTGPAETGLIDRPAKTLRGFAKVYLQPGESKTVSIQLDDQAYSYYNVKTSSFEQIAGTYNIYAGNSSANLPLQTQVTIQ